MNLLIVDDQKIVVDGIVNGVDWVNIGFDHVFTAYNALDAKEILNNHTIEIMLCDIEMPVESGVDLLAWIKKRRLETLCIFLTAHAEFTYAQNVIRLGGYDYIIQPASYEEISKAVQRAVKEVEESKKSKELSQMGELFQTQENNILSVILTQYLEGKEVEKTYSKYEGYGKLPCRFTQGTLVLVQILRWRSCEVWEDSLLYMTLNNILSELFENIELKVTIAQMDETIYAVVIKSKSNKKLELEDINRQLQFFNSVCNQFLKCEIATYNKVFSSDEKMPDIWSVLFKMKDNNVSMKAGIYTEEHQSTNKYIYRLPHIYRWNDLMINGNMNVVELEAYNFLDDLVNSGKINASILLEFYQDFLQMVYTATAELRISVKDMFRKPEEIELYNQGMNSVSHMKKLIHHIMKNFNCISETLDDVNLVDKTIEYIMTHLDEDIRRDDLANYVHLNSDYLTKLFKKETGLTLKEFVIKQKMQEAQTLIKSTNLPIGFISSKIGYYNFSHFSFTYKKVMGITPNEERKLVDEGNEKK